MRRLQPAMYISHARNGASATLIACAAAALLSQRGSTRQQGHGALCTRLANAAASVRVPEASSTGGVRWRANPIVAPCK
eukprot:5774810-Alexandrium_andersonii.AAC.1